MSKQGHARAVSVQAYGKPRGGGLLTPTIATGLAVTGFGAAALAVTTAVMPVAPDQLAPVIEGIDRLGLDKGPLAFFGAVMIGLAFILRRLGSIGGGSNEASRAAAFAEQTAGDLEGLSAITAALQVELGALRQDVAGARREIQEAGLQSATDSGEPGNDPIFRLAASLDQLGARVDKRIDGTRTELLEAVEAMGKSMTGVTREQTEAAREQRVEFEGLRMDMVDLHAEISRVNDGVLETFSAIEKPLVNDEQPAAAHGAVGGGAASLPRELSEPRGAPLPPRIEAEGPIAPLPVQPERRAEPETPGFDFPSPPPPIPAPSEGLELLDDMEEDRARGGDAAPPLFPDLDSSGF